MKPFYRILFLLLSALGLFSNRAMACDVCGGISPAAMGGLLPVLKSSIIGVRTQFRPFIHPTNPPNMNGNSRVLSDHIWQSAIWVRTFPKPRWQVYAELPYSVQYRQETKQNTLAQGPGDALASISFVAINSPDSVERKIKYAVLTGIQIGLPTGSYQLRDATGKMLPLGLQSGTGCWSAGSHLNATLRSKKWGLNLDGRFTYFAKNERGLQPGIATTVSLRTFAFLNTPKVTWLPSMGILYEQMEKEREFGLVKTESGVSRMSAQMGLDVFIRNAFASVQIQWPVVQQKTNSQPNLLAAFQISLGYIW
jgi:hypothetical protein